MAFRPKRLLACCLAVGLLGGGLSAVSASEHGSLRLFRLNLQHQLVKSADVGGAAGCRNFLWPPRVYRVAQLGYAYCELYTERNCPADSIVRMLWLGSHYRPQNLDPNVPQLRILPGTRWQVYREDDLKKDLRVASRRCVYQAE